MIETIYYESGTHRIEVQRNAGHADIGTRPWFTWFGGKLDADGYARFRGYSETLDDCLGDAAGELLEVDSPDWTVSRDQRTAVL